MSGNYPTAQALCLQAIEVSRGYIGVDRDNDQAQVARFLGLFGLPFAEDGTPVSYCACGVGWAFTHALADLLEVPYDADSAPHVFHGLLPELIHIYFEPDPSCGTFVGNLVSRNLFLSGSLAQEDIKPGYIVFFDFPQAGHPDHVEIVVSAESDGLHTIGYNTGNEDNANGGAVEPKVRNYGQVFGYGGLY